MCLDSIKACIPCEQCLHVERHTEVVGGERSHNFTAIALDNSSEDGDGSRDGLLAKETTQGTRNRSEHVHSFSLDVDFSSIHTRKYQA